MERNGFIFLWHHAEGLEPTWEPPEIEEITQGKWKYHGRTEHFVSAHIEVSEIITFLVPFTKVTLVHN